MAQVTPYAGSATNEVVHIDEASPIEAWGSGSLESARPGSGELGAGQWAILEAIARGAWLPELLLSIVSLVEHQAEDMLCSLLIHDPTSGTLRHGAARRLAPELCAFVDGMRVGPSSGSCGLAALRRQRVVVTDIATHPAWSGYREPFLAHGLRACWSTPILSPSGQLLGTLGLYFAQSRGPTASECAWADAATHLAAIALSRAQAEREHDHLLVALEARVQELTLLHESARLLRAHRVGLGEQLEALVKMIPSGWRYASRCRARIRSHGIDVSTPGFVDGPLKQTAYAPAGEHRVSIEVVHLGEAPAGDAFVVEEQTLLESLADLVGAHLEKHHAEDALRATLAELREKNQRLEFHVSRMPLGLVVWDRERTITQWNPAAERIFGWRAEEVLGQRSNQLAIVPEHARETDALGRELAASDGNIGRGTHEHVHRDGSLLVCDWLHAPLKDEYDAVIGYLSMAHDVTERQRAEDEHARLAAELQQAQRLKALGTLAGGIAHDFNNILTAIAGHAHLGLSDIEEERSPKESLHAIQEASTRAVELVRRILMFSRPQVPERKACSVGAVVEEVLAGFRGGSPRILFEARIDPRAPFAFADPLQLHQALANLVANAVRAVGESGRIEIEVDAIANDHEELIGASDARFARYVRITVSDTGVGMDEQTRERIFEPFFSTKPTGQGTGLGLSVVHGIVKSHEGTISVRSKAGHGSVFRVYLPEAAAPEVVARAPSPSRPPSAGAHVMYVDDEEPLVALAVRWLGRLGYKVSGFSDPRGALAAFREHPDAYDALISDVSMPEVSGFELVRQVLAIRPSMVIVMSSGYLTPEDRQRALDAGALDVVQKPQSMAELGRILHRILSERAGARSS
jgi:PAS domain S-box-containing protein